MKQLERKSMRYVLRQRFLLTVGLTTTYCFLTVLMYRILPSPGAASRAEIQVATGNVPPIRNVALLDGYFYVDGERFIVKSVGWDPVRPGELPWTRGFRAEEIEGDFSRIRAAGFNTVRTWAALKPEELDLADRHGLKVLQGIWVQPDGDFADPGFRREALTSVRGVVETSRWSPTIIGYLVMNEPRGKAVAQAGLENAVSFLREVVATVRALDPSAPVGYASWPGMEAFHDDLLDFVAFNIYPHRPRWIMADLGLEGYVQMLRRTVARGRPLLISEFGVSVSPELPEVDQARGGATENEQAESLCDLLTSFLAAEAAGTSVFQWSDGWWKNHEEPGDELIHDPADPEEWFGLVKFEDLGDRVGRPRPALQALTQRQRAILVHPSEVGPSANSVELHLYGTQTGQLMARVAGGSPVSVSLVPQGSRWLRGSLALPAGENSIMIAFELRGEGGEKLWWQERRIIRTSARRIELEMTPRSVSVGPGQDVRFDIVAVGDGSRTSRVLVATYSENHHHEERLEVVLDSRGRGTVSFRAPAEPTILTVVALDPNLERPSTLRAASWSVVEVRPQ